MKLNQKQYEAVTDNHSDTLVLAGAGTGKTRVLISRVEYLLKNGVSPSEIVCFTFTKKAANVMLWRLRQDLSSDIIDKLSVSTFHSFMVPYVFANVGILGYETNEINIITESDITYFINKVIDELKPNISNKELRTYISNIKNKKALPNLSLEQEAQLVNCYKKYQELLKRSSSIDMDDILLLFYEALLKDESFLEFMQSYKYILVDECQDTNPIQYEILKLMRGKNNHLFFCGDDDQSIYSFRGADPFLIKRYIDEYHPYQIILDKNYRSLPGVIKASSNLIKNNVNRVDKVYKTDKSSEAIIQAILCNNNRHEALQLCSIINQFHEHGYEYKEMAVLFRNNVIAEHLEPYLLKYKIPHTKTRMNFLESEEIKFVMNYYRFLNEPNNDLYLQNIINHPIFEFEASEINKFKNQAKKINESLLQILKYHDEENSKVKYFLDKYYILNDEFNYYSLLDFYETMISILGLENYYSEKENGRLKLSRLEAFKEFLDSQEEANPKQAAIRIINNLLIDTEPKNEEERNQVQFMTIHQAKGLEFKIVIIPGMEEGILPSAKAKTPLQIEEERRICYVGISRAEDNCILLHNKKRYLYGKERTQKESRFLLEIGGES